MRAGLRQHLFSRSWAWPKYYFLHPFFDLVSVSHIHDGSPMQFTCLHPCKSCHHSLEVTLFDTFGLLFMYRWVNPSPPPKKKYSFLQQMSLYWPSHLGSSFSSLVISSRMKWNCCILIRISFSLTPILCFLILCLSISYLLLV